MRDGLHSAYDYCRALTRREAKNFYYGFLLLPEHQRRAIYAAYAFARHCDDIVDEGLPPEEAKSRLDEQRALLERCAAGEPDGPVFKALGHVIRKYEVPVDYFRDLIRGVEMDLTIRRYETFDELREYCRLVASVVGLICIEIFGYRGGEKARRYAEDLGVALQLTNILRDVREDAGRDRVYLPQEDLAFHGYSEEELMSGRVTPEFRRLIAYQVDRARDHYDNGRRLLPYLPRRAAACVGAMAGIYASILDDISRDPAVIFRRRVSIGAGRKMALAGRELVRSALR